jgi:hypothetical protein
VQDTYTPYSSGQALTPVVTGNAALPDNAPLTAPSESSPATDTVYYLRLGTGGQVAIANNVNWFQVALPPSEISDPVSIVGSGVPILGPAQFGPLSFTFDAGSQLNNTLLGLLVSGTPITELEVQAYSVAGTTATPLDDYIYTGVQVTGLTAGTGTDTLSFSYVSSATKHFITPQVVTEQDWSTTTNSPSLNPAATLASGTPFSAGHGADVRGSTNLTYFVEFDSGSIKDDGGNTWLAITDPSISLTHSSGAAILGTLSLTLAQPSRATITLQGDLEQQKHLANIQIAAYDDAGNLVEDYSIGAAFVTSETPTSPDTPAESFSFLYTQVQDTYTPYSSGQALTPVVTGNAALPDNAPLSEPQSTACYCRGTLVRTRHGEKAVESLEIGEEVRTVSGALRPIKWLGRRSYGGRFILGRKDVLPICIKAGALADNVPVRDLWVSPQHAMYFAAGLRGGLLIESKDLVNGISILQAERVKTVDYFHIELETHDAIFAEGAASETFIDDDSRGIFHNAQEYAALYADTANRLAHYCAARLDAGHEVETVRRAIASRAGLLPNAAAPRISELRGYIDLVGPRCIAGWAQNMENLEAAVCLDIIAGETVLGQVLANEYRDDLRRAGIGSGRHAFAFSPPGGGRLTAVQVRRSLDGAALRLSPRASLQLSQARMA